MSPFIDCGDLRENEMEVVNYLLENPWLFFILLIPLVAPFETLLLLISFSYVSLVYFPYKVILSAYRKIQNKETTVLTSQQTEAMDHMPVPYALVKNSCTGCGSGVLKGSVCAYCGSTYTKIGQLISLSERQGA